MVAYCCEVDLFPHTRWLQYFGCNRHYTLDSNWSLQDFQIQQLGGCEKAFRQQLTHVSLLQICLPHFFASDSLLVLQQQ